MQNTLDAIKRGTQRQDEDCSAGTCQQRCSFGELKEIVGFPKYFVEEARYKTL